MIEQRDSIRRKNLQGAVRLFMFVLLLTIFYVFIDYTFNSGQPPVAQGYRYQLPQLQDDAPLILSQDRLAVVVIKRSAAVIEQLQQSRSGLADAASAHSRQPAFAQNPLRSRHQQYFVALATGTDYGCPLRTGEQLLHESCSDAVYDFAGRAARSARGYKNLTVPEYDFSSDFSHLTVTMQ